MSAILWGCWTPVGTGMVRIQTQFARSTCALEQCTPQLCTVPHFVPPLSEFYVFSVSPCFTIISLLSSSLSAPVCHFPVCWPHASLSIIVSRLSACIQAIRFLLFIAILFFCALRYVSRIFKPLIFQLPVPVLCSCSPLPVCSASRLPVFLFRPRLSSCLRSPAPSCFLFPLIDTLARPSLVPDHELDFLYRPVRKFACPRL